MHEGQEMLGQGSKGEVRDMVTPSTYSYPPPPRTHTHTLTCITKGCPTAVHALTLVFKM